jgi:hypothetical protein
VPKVKWRGRHRWPAAVGKLDLIIMSGAFIIFGLSLLVQPHRWHATPAYHDLLLILPAQAWGGLFLASGVSMGIAVWQFARRWAVIASLTLAFMLDGGWMLAFVVRYLTSPSTTPETWVSWAVFGFLLLKVAISLDRSLSPLPPPDAEVAAFRQAVDAALSAAEEDQRTAVARTLAAGWDRYGDAVSAACTAYGDALRAAVPVAAMPPGDLAATALAEARHALIKAEEAFARSTGQPAPHQDPP